jgi:hypothetical protein
MKTKTPACSLKRSILISKCDAKFINKEKQQ